ncbi:MAG: S9 family peptidase, partial [Gracilimonas sp.]|nr:S9 family peptidase [Gracilimonas sp.]
MQSYKIRTFFLVLIGLMTTTSATAQGVLSFEDVMKFEDIGSIELSDNGNWVAYEVWPDRGDGKVEVKSTNGRTTYSMELGASPKITPNGAWVAAFRKVPLAEELKDSKEKPQQGLSILSTNNGEISDFDSVRSFQFSEDGNWLAIHHMQSKKVEDLNSKNKNLGTKLLLKNLESGDEFDLPFVREMAFDSLSNYLAYSTVDTSNTINGVYVFDLNAEESQRIDSELSGLYANLTWDFDEEKLAFTKATYDTSLVESNASLHIWKAENEELLTLLNANEGNDGFSLRSNNNFTFTNDGKRLFFGFMSSEMAYLDSKKEEKEDEEVEVYDIEDIVEDRGLDIWHDDDPRIKTHEIETWESRKNHLFTAVYHLEKNEWVQLADHEMEDIRVAHNPNVVLGSSQKPYLKEMTWEGFFNDWYYVDLETGERTLIGKKLSEGVNLSPGGNFAAFYVNKNWNLVDIENGTSRNITSDLDVPFYNEDHDYPSRVPDYGVAGWIENDEAVLIYDKYDIWRFPTDLSEPTN